MEVIKVKQKTNRQENVKTYFQRLMILMAAIMVSTALVGCDTGDDPGNGGGNTTGTINKELVGKWGGGWQGMSHYYDFKADGTFLHRMVNSIYVGGTYIRSENDYFRGTWRENGGTVYMTRREHTTFVGGGKPPANLQWTKLSDQTMRIKFGVHPSDHPNLGFPNKRYFENLELVYVTPDGSLPDAYCTLTLDNYPDWVFP